MSWVRVVAALAVALALVASGLLTTPAGAAPQPLWQRLYVPPGGSNGLNVLDLFYSCDLANPASGVVEERGPSFSIGLIGDSVGVMLAAAVDEDLSWGPGDTELTWLGASRCGGKFSNQLGQADLLLARQPSAFVVQLGTIPETTNPFDAVPGMFAATRPSADQFLARTAGHPCRLLVELPETGRDAKTTTGQSLWRQYGRDMNAYLAQYAATHPGTYLVEWSSVLDANPGLAYDGVHLTHDGMNAMLNAIVGATQQCTPRLPYHASLLGPGVGSNADGRQEVFVPASDGRIWHAWQVAPNSGWSGWLPFDAWARGGPAVGTNADGRLEFFFVGTDNRVWHHWQNWAGGSWSAPLPLGARTFQRFTGLSIAANLDGRLELFASGDDGQVWHTWQVAPNADWSGWFPLSGPVRSAPGVGREADGRLTVVVAGNDGALWRSSQVVPGGGWSGWTSLGGSWPALLTPAVAANADGRLEIFATGHDRQLWHAWEQTPNGAWSGWFPLGADVRGAPAVGRNADGRLEVFALDQSKRLVHVWQVAPNSGWSGWLPYGGTWS